jgi:hypothetical protein
MLIVGWFMAKIEFFSKIKSKFINKKFSALYIEKTHCKVVKGGKNLAVNHKNIGFKDYNSLEQSIESV